jgi:hypothetical protein
MCGIQPRVTDRSFLTSRSKMFTAKVKPGLSALEWYILSKNHIQTCVSGFSNSKDESEEYQRKYLSWMLRDEIFFDCLVRRNYERTSLRKFISYSHVPQNIYFSVTKHTVDQRRQNSSLNIVSLPWNLLSRQSFTFCRHLEPSTQGDQFSKTTNHCKFMEARVSRGTVWVWYHTMTPHDRTYQERPSKY